MFSLSGYAASSQKILMIGDSHSVLSYGPALHGLLKTGGAQVRSYAVGATTPLQWADNDYSGFNGFFDTIKMNIIDEDGAKSTTPHKLGLAPLKTDFNPNVVIITLGTNVIGQTGSARELRIQKSQELAQMASAGGTKCYWVGPPRIGTSAKNKLDQTIEEIKNAVSSFCTFIDSKPLTAETELSTDQIHYTTSGGKSWAQAVFNQLKSSGLAVASSSSSSSEAVFSSCLPIEQQREEYVPLSYPTDFKGSTRTASDPINTGLVWIPRGVCGKSVDVLIALHGWRSLENGGDSIYLAPPAGTFYPSYSGQQTVQKQFDVIIRDRNIPLVVAAPMHDRGPNKDVFTADAYNINIHLQKIESILNQRGVSINRISITGHSNANCAGALTRAVQQLDLKWKLHLVGSLDGTCQSNQYVSELIPAVKQKGGILFHMHQGAYSGDETSAGLIKQESGGPDASVQWISKYADTWVSSNQKLYTYLLKPQNDPELIKPAADYTHGIIPQEWLREILPRFSFATGAAATSGIDSVGNQKIAIMGASNEVVTAGYASVLETMYPSAAFFVSAQDGYSIREQEENLLPDLLEKNPSILIVNPSGNTCTKLGASVGIITAESIVRKAQAANVQKIIFLTISPRRNVDYQPCIESFNQKLKLLVGSYVASYVAVADIYAAMVDPNQPGACPSSYCDDSPQQHWKPAAHQLVAQKINEQLGGSGASSSGIAPGNGKGIVECAAEWTDATTEEKALLDTLAYAEATTFYGIQKSVSSYNIMLGGRVINDLSGHPRKTGEMLPGGFPFGNGDDTSTAAGRYQFLYCKDSACDSFFPNGFGPIEQDKEAWKRVEDKRGVSLSEVENAGSNVARWAPLWDKLALEWASIRYSPKGTSYYGQGDGYSHETLTKAYSLCLAHYQNGGAKGARFKVSSGEAVSGAPPPIVGSGSAAAASSISGTGVTALQLEQGCANNQRCKEIDEVWLVVSKQLGLQNTIFVPGKNWYTFEQVYAGGTAATE